MGKIFKKVLIALLVVIILLCDVSNKNFALLNFNVRAAESIPDGYIGIYSAKDFYNIRNNLSGKYILMNDIDLGVYSNWTPIGNSSEKFNGVLNGNGYTISNATISDHDNLSYYGLFGYINSASFSSLTIENMTIEVTATTTSSTYVGSLFGYASSVSISDVSIFNTSMTVKATNGVYVGTVAGCLKASLLSNIKATGTIHLNASGTYAGGAFGYMSASGDKTFSNVELDVDMIINSSSVNFGGFVGYFYDSSYDTTVYFKNIMTDGDINIYATGTLRVSGIIGYCGGEPLDIFQYCQSSMNINITATGATSYIGGILAHGTTWDGVKFYNCGFSGSISETTASTNVYFGGIVGYYYQSYGLSSTYTSQCYNSGSLSLTGSSRISKAYLGGLIGFVDADGYYSQTLINCFNCGDITATNCSNLYVGGVVAALYGYTVTVEEAYTVGTIRYSNISSASESNFRGGYYYQKNCYYIEGGNCNSAGSGTMLTAVQFKNKENLVGFNFSSIWTYLPSSGYEYPVLRNTKFNATLTLNCFASGATVLEYSSLEAIDNAILTAKDGKTKIEADGYYTAEFSDSISATDGVTIYGLVPESTNSHISAVHCNSMDALVNSENVKFSIMGSSTTDKEKELQIQVYTDLAEYEKFQLLYDGTVIAESETGIFDLTVGDIPSGHTLKVRVVDLNGTKYSKIDTNIKTYEITPTWEIADDKFTITIPEDIVIIGGTTFSLDLTTLPVFIIKDEDTIKIGLGASETSTYSKLNGKTTSASSLLGTVSDEGATTLWEYWKKMVSDEKYKIADGVASFIMQESFQKFEGFDLKGSNVFSNGASSNIDANVAAYVELKYVDGKWTTIGADGFMKVSGTTSCSWQAVVLYVPIVFNLSGTIGAETDFNIGFDFDNNKVIYDADVDITLPKVKGSAGIGIVNVFNGSGFVELTNKIKFDFGNKITGKLSGDLGISGKFVVFSAEKSLWKFADWEYLNVPLNNSTTPAATEEYKLATLSLYEDEIDNAASDLYDESTYSLDTRDYLSAQSEWYGDVNIQLFASDEITEQDKLLQSAIYDSANPKVATTKNGTTIMVWTADIAARTIGNQTAIVYSIYDSENDTWSSPIIVSDDGTADAFVDITTNQDDIYLTWLNTNKEFDSDVEIDEFASACEICIAKYNPDACVFEEISNITNNEYFDFMPSIYADDESIYVAFVENENNDALMQSGNNTINVVKVCDGNSDIIMQNTIESPIESLDVTKIKEDIIVAFTRDIDGNLETTDDIELYTMDESGYITQVTNNFEMEANINFYNINGAVALAYYSNDSINYTYDFKTINTITNNDAINVSPQYMFVNDSEGTLLLSNLAMQGDETTSIYASVWNGTEWSGTSKVSNSNNNVKNFFGYTDINGNTNIIYTTSTFKNDLTTDNGDGSYSGTYTETVDMFSTSFCRTSDIELVNVFFENTDVNPGFTLPTILTIRNNGLYSVKELNISCKCNGSEYLDFVNVDIEPGQTQNIEYNASVPSTLSALSDIEFVVTCDNDNDSENNSAKVKIGYTDIALKLEKYTSVGNTSLGLFISNISAIATGATIIVHKDTYSSDIVAEFKVPNIDKYSTEYFYLDSGFINGNFDQGDAVCIEVVSNVDEKSLSDNSQFITVDVAEVEEYEYNILEDNKISITAYNGSATNLEIPSTYDDYTISEIAACAIPNTVESIVLPKTIENVNANTFNYATSLKSITVAANNSYYCSENGILYSSDKTQLVRCPIGIENKNVVVEDGILELCDYAFYKTNLASITLPSTLKTIGSYSFAYNCFDIISIPENVTTIEKYSFGYCYSLKEVEYNAIAAETGITSLLNSVFSNCSNIKVINIGTKVTKIPVGLFSQTGVEIVNILGESELTAIEKYAFYSCSNLEDINYGRYYKYWKLIEFSNIGNTALGEANLHCLECAQHIWDEGVYTVIPTCISSGTKFYVCGICEKERTDDVSIDANNHPATELRNQKSSTCTSDGYTGDTYCTKCETKLSSGSTIDATGHSLTIVEKQESTCASIGWEEYSYCINCDYTTYEEIAALGHDIIVDEAKAPTCTDTGLTKGSHCSRCDNATVAQEVVPATNHTGTLVQVKAQAKTCTEIGWDAYEYCTECDYTTYVEIPASHSIVTVYKKDSTCIEVGYEAYKYCTACVYTTFKEIPVAEHTKETVKGYTATCTKAGLTDGVKCSVCGETLIAQQSIAKLAHKDDNGDYKCDYGCGHEFEKPIEPEQPDTPDEPSDGDCDHLCHKSGFMGFIWKIVRFFWKLFKMNPICECGVAHY